LPFSASETLTFYTEQEKAAVLKPDFVISGNILFDNNNSWLIQPVVSDNWNDSLVLQPLQGSLQNKEELLARVLNEVQLFLNTIDTTSNNLASLKSLFLFNGDYQRAFDSARSSKNYDLALYYASKIPDKKDLLTAEVSYDRGDYDGVLESLHSYIGKDSVDVEIYYYYGLAYIKKGRYQSAKEIFSRINEELLPERNLHYQLGVCLYHQDSLQKALDQFTRQLKMSESPMDIYAYIGSIYMNRDEWKQAEESYLYLYRYDTSNVVYKRYLSDFYLDVADSKYKKKAYHEAGIYYKEAYTFGRSDQSLLGAITAFAHAGDEDSVYSVVAIAANDTLADLGSIYVEASVNCRVQRDEEPASFPFLTRLSVFLLTSYLESPHSSVYAVAQELGSDYFRLRKLDSAEYFYKIALTYNGNEPTNYFNLAELQIIELKADSALATLEKARLKFHLDTTDQKGNYLVKDDYYEGIYLIYSCQANILMKKDINKYYYRLKRILSKHKRENPKNGLFSNWSFVTYLTWLNSEGKISITIKRLMMENLCVISEYTYDTNFSCELK
jgi:Flp pilus assembly protein TadD